jgi:hypothetical protein
MPDDPRARLAQEVAAGCLEHVALQLAAVHQAIVVGEASQALLRARRAALTEAALAYARAVGWQPPPTGAA